MAARPVAEVRRANMLAGDVGRLVRALRSPNGDGVVDSQGDATLVTVWKGKGVATGNGDAVRVDSRRQVRFVSGMSLAHQTYGEPRLDGFDQWCQVRAEREARVLSVRYVSPDVIGYEDLDEAVRRFLAWESIVTDTTLNLDKHQMRQADIQMRAADGAVTIVPSTGDDDVVIQLNVDALRQLGAHVKELVIVPRAGHLFEEPGKLEEVARLAADWFTHYVHPPVM